jgi:hypothetical protein
MVENENGKAAGGEALERVQSGQDGGRVVFAAACHEGSEDR